MENEDPQDRPEEISLIINGLERYNPERLPSLESYLAVQCEERYCDCNANRTLLKLYQLNPERIQGEIITNILVKAMTCFPSPQFSSSLHLLPPSSLSPTAGTELPEAVAKLRELNNHLEGAQYARFWATLDSDDLYADLVTDINGFEDLIRSRIAVQVGAAFRELELSRMAEWLGLTGDQEAEKWVEENLKSWKVEGTLVKVPRNADNEAKKVEVREDVNVDMFSRVVRRGWEESVI